MFVILPSGVTAAETNPVVKSSLVKMQVEMLTDLLEYYFVDL
jgi:hypothetical protein